VSEKGRETEINVSGYRSALFHSPRWMLPLCTGSADGRQGARKEIIYLSLPPISFPAPGCRSQLTGCLLRVGCALWLVMRVGQALGSAVLQHRAVLSAATSPRESCSSPKRTSAVHLAWR